MKKIKYLKSIYTSSGSSAKKIDHEFYERMRACKRLARRNKRKALGK